GGDLCLELDLQTETPVTARNLSIRVTDSRGLTLFTCSTRGSLNTLLSLEDRATVHCTIRNVRLIPARYYLRMAFRSGRHVIDVVRSGVVFEVLPLWNDAAGRVPTARNGVIVAEAQWDIGSLARRGAGAPVMSSNFDGHDE